MWSPRLPENAMKVGIGNSIQLLSAIVSRIRLGGVSWLVLVLRPTILA